MAGLCRNHRQRRPHRSRVVCLRWAVAIPRQLSRVLQSMATGLDLPQTDTCHRAPPGPTRDCQQCIRRLGITVRLACIHIPICHYIIPCTSTRCLRWVWPSHPQQQRPRQRPLSSTHLLVWTVQQRLQEGRTVLQWRLVPVIRRLRHR